MGKDTEVFCDTSTGRYIHNSFCGCSHQVRFLTISHSAQFGRNGFSADRINSDPTFTLNGQLAWIITQSCVCRLSKNYIYYYIYLRPLMEIKQSNKVINKLLEKKNKLELVEIKRRWCIRLERASLQKLFSFLSWNEWKYFTKVVFNETFSLHRIRTELWTFF